MNGEQEQSDTVFGKILRKEIPADFVFESERLVAIRDIEPAAPVHILVIPRKPIEDVSKAKDGDESLIGEMVLTAAELARQEGIEASGYRLILNCGEDGGLMVPHLHLHLIGGKKLSHLG